MAWRVRLCVWGVCGSVSGALACGATPDSSGDSADGAPTAGSDRSGGQPSSSTGGSSGAGGSQGTGGGSNASSGGSESQCESPDPCGICGGDGASCGCSDELCRAIVEEHNRIRAAVNAGEYFDQPAASPALAPLVWDPQIAEKAQEYADSMDDWSMGHSSQQFRTYQSTYHNGYHGENMAIGGGRYADPTYFVAEGWGASEAQECQLASCGGHYTQIVWRDTVALGCGRKEGVSFNGNVGTLTVCQYGPGGNVNGRAPY